MRIDGYSIGFCMARFSVMSSADRSQGHFHGAQLIAEPFEFFQGIACE